MTESDKNKKAAGGGSSRKVLNLLFAFDERRPTATVAELAEIVDVPVPSAYRYVALLKDLMLLEESAPGRYGPSTRVVSLARAAQVGNPIVNLSRPILERAVADLNETVLLMQYVGDSTLVCIQVVECNRPMRYTYEIGHIMPLGRGASGKMMLAELPEAEREAWMRENGSSSAFREEVERIVASRNATSSGELHSGVWASCVPVTRLSGRPVVLTVAGPAARISESAREDATGVLHRAAGDIRDGLARITL